MHSVLFNLLVKTISILYNMDSFQSVLTRFHPLPVCCTGAGVAISSTGSQVETFMITLSHGIHNRQHKEDHHDHYQLLKDPRQQAWVLQAGS